MDNTDLSRQAQWLKAKRGVETQDRLAQDISKVTGWRITRDRYSKYESGSLPIGPKVLRHFLDYWATRGIDAPDFASPLAGATETADPVVTAIDRQTAAIDRQTAMLRAVLEAIAGPALDPDRQAWAQARLAEAIQSPNPTPDHNGERVR